MRTAWLAIIALPLIFAGCVDCVSGPPVSARDIANAPASGGASGFALDITITDGPGGPPLPDAGVVVYYGSDDVGEWRGPRVDVSDERVLVEPFNATGTPESRTTLRMMSDANGHVRARVPGNRIIGIVAAKDGYTEEWLPAVAAGDLGTEGAIRLPLYRSVIELDVDGVWGPGSASTGAVTSSQYGWDPRPVPFAETDAANRGYAARIVEMDVTLEWSNGVTGAGDLGIGIGAHANGPSYFADGSSNVGQGPQTESTMVGLAELSDHGILMAPRIEAGAATKSAFVAPFGLPYTMHITARFDTARAAYGACNRNGSENDNDGLGATVPGQGTLGAIGALTLAAILVARVRPS